MVVAPFCKPELTRVEDIISELDLLRTKGIIGLQSKQPLTARSHRFAIIAGISKVEEAV